MVYFSIGWPAFLALGVLALAVPIQIYLTKKLVDNREVIIPFGDHFTNLWFLVGGCCNGQKNSRSSRNDPWN